MKKLFVFSAAAAMLMAAACDKARTSNPITNAAQAAKDPALQGKAFKGKCSDRLITTVFTALAAGKALKSAHATYRFDGANVTRATLLYPETDCKGDVAYTFEEQGVVDIKDADKTKDDARFIDMVFDKVFVVINSDVGVKVANGIKLCEVEDWAMNQRREVTQVAKNKTCYNTELPRTEHNVYRLEDNTLILGAKDSADKTGRPTALDRDDEVYKAQ